jgi:long-chain acyl-CoA synthetase
MLSSSAKRFGGKALVIATDRTLTFEETERLSNVFASYLRRIGINPGDVVTIWMENGWRWIVVYYGILKAGAVVNPVNIQLTPAEIAFIANDCSAKAIVASAQKAKTLHDLGHIPVIVDREPESDQPDLDRILSWAENAAPTHAPNITLSSPATIGYTSGTTGHPKGAVLTHRSILLNTAMTSLMHGRHHDDVVVSALPCPHVYGNVVMNCAAHCGLTLVLLPRFDEALVLEAIQRHAATLFEGVPTMYMKMLNMPQFAQYDLSSLRLCTVGGQTMPLATMREVEQRFKAPLIELWGMTELGGLGTTHPHNGPSKLGSIGIALPLTEAKVVALDEPSKTVARGEVGELLVRGPLVMNGYHGKPTETRQTIDDDGWLHTGDLVRQDEEGYFFVVDRIKEMILSGGYNVYPAEIERVIAQHPAVAMVAIASLNDELKGHVPKAFVVLRNNTTCNAQELIDHCRSQLASYKVPKAVDFLDDLPKTSTGKILRRALQA